MPASAYDVLVGQRGVAVNADLRDLLDNWRGGLAGRRLILRRPQQFRQPSMTIASGQLQAVSFDPLLRHRDLRRDVGLAVVGELAPVGDLQRAERERDAARESQMFCGSQTPGNGWPISIDA